MHDDSESRGAVHCDTDGVITGTTDADIIRDYGDGDGLNFSGVPFAFLTGDGASVTIILDSADRDVVRVEAVREWFAAISSEQSEPTLLEIALSARCRSTISASARCR